MADLTKLLHIGHRVIGSPDNTGLTLTSMFASWPDSHLLQVYARGEGGGPTVRAGGFELPGQTYPLDHWGRKILGSKTPKGFVDGMNNSVKRSEKLTWKANLKLAAITLNDIAPVLLPHSLDKVVEEFQPEVLHSLLGGAREMAVVLAASRRYDLPILPHYMDDWPENLHRNTPVKRLARAKVEGLHARILERSPVGLAIGVKMAEEYTARYGREFLHVGNSVPRGELLAAARSAPGSARVLRYVGGLHLGRDRVVARIAQGLVAVGAGDWVIEVVRPGHSAAAAARLAQDHPNVRDAGEVAPDAVPSVLATSGCLLFIESEDPGVVPFTRYSVSTKVPEYIASGRPVLCVGPEDQGSVDAFIRHAHALAVSAEADDWTKVGDFLAGLGEARPSARTNVEALADEFSREATQERLAMAARKARDLW